MRRRAANPSPGSGMRMFLVLSILALACPLHAADPAPFGPWEADPAAQESGERKTAGLPDSFLVGSIRFYQDVLSPVIGADCPMHPSCSAYGIEAVRKHGFLLGIFMIADRLIHESDEISLGTEIETEGRRKVHDPVENNDFWWAGPEKRP
ncbi:MAG TPA: membrane protein insertion efficiency factor YidD [Syntrophales bacterium]|nr:membrane protein insertion efficiency factor YidD [Syntrophales bacterium]